jgi:integrase
MLCWGIVHPGGLAAVIVPVSCARNPDPTEFAALTGWRLMEVLDLRWDRVDFDARVIRLEAGESKSRRPRVFPFGPMPRLAALLDRQRQERWRVERERGVAVDTVFHREGRPLKDIDDAWRTACRRAKLEGRHFHDLRRYACASMIAAGVAPTEAMALMGHATLSMHLRYGITSTAMLEQAVAKVAARGR